MKRITLPLFGLFFCIYASAQIPTLNITAQSQWNPDSVPQYSDIWGYVDCNGNEYAILGSRYQIHFIDVTQPTSPAEVADFEGGEASVWRDIKTYRDRAYSVSDGTEEGLMIFYLGNLPLSVEQTYQSNELFNNAQNIFIDEEHGRLYVAGSNAADLLIFDLTENPDQPVLLAELTLPGGYIRDLHVRDNVAYCSHLAEGLYIYDFTNPQSFAILGSINDYPGEVLNSSSWLSTDGSQLVFCDETHGAQVKLLDVSDPSNLVVPESHLFGSALLGTSTNSIANKPYIIGDYVFVSYYHDGVQVFDISNPNDIQNVAYYDTFLDNTNYDGIQGNWGNYPYLPSGNVLASDINNGMFILSMETIELEPADVVILADTDIELSSDPVICEGDSVQFIAAEGDNFTYLWTLDGEILDIETNVLTAKETGVYQLEIFNGICTSVSEVIEVAFLEKPDLSSMTGDVADICVGTTYNIMAPMGLDYYIWLKDGNVLPNGNNLLMTYETGTYTLLAYKNGCSATSEAYVVTAFEVPQPELSLDQSYICNNEIATFEAVPGAESYSWYMNGSLILETSDHFLDASQGGNYHVVANTGTCEKVSETLLLTVMQSPNNNIGVNGSTTFCEGESITINAAQTSDIIGWTWTLGNDILSNEPNIEVFEGGHYELHVVSSNGCTATNSIDIEVYTVETPEVDFDGSYLMSTAAESYQWYFNGEAIPGLTSQNIPANNNGTYQVEITNANGCTSISEPFEIEITSTKTPESLINLSVYPNPASSFITIDLTSSLNSRVNVQLIALNGKVLKNMDIASASTIHETIDVSDLPSGMYLLQLNNEEGSTTKRVIKN